MTITGTVIDFPFTGHPYAGRDASGYGRAIPTNYAVKCSDRRTRRVYVYCYSNSGTAYVKIKDPSVKRGYRWGIVPDGTRPGDVLSF